MKKSQCEGEYFSFGGAKSSLPESLLVIDVLYLILPNLTSSNSWLILSSRNQGNFLESLHSHLLFNPSPLAWLGLSEWLRWQLHLALKSATGLFFCQKKSCPFSPHLHQRSSPYLSTAEVELLQNHPIGRVGLHYYLFTLVRWKQKRDVSFFK